jgi:hypothetical protein
MAQPVPQVHHMQQSMQHAQYYPEQQAYQAAGYEYHYAPPPQQQQMQMQQQMPQLEQESRKSRGSTGQTNERELKEMLSKNDERSLDDVADEVIANERTSSSEKSKQLFAMLWYVDDDMQLQLTYLGSAGTWSPQNSRCHEPECTLSMLLDVQSIICSL